MSNWLAGGTSAFDACSRQWRMRFKPPMTFHRAMEYGTTGTNNNYHSYVREEWTPLPIGVRQNTVTTFNALINSGIHIYDFGTFRRDAGYEVLYAVPRGRMACLSIEMHSYLNRTWVNLAVVPNLGVYGGTPPQCYLLYQTLIWPDTPLNFDNIMMEEGTEIRFASTSAIPLTISGVVTANA